MASFNDWLTGLFIKQEDVDTAHEVAAGQDAIIERQHDDGVIDDREYRETKHDIADAGDYLDREKNKAPSLLGTVPWWVWAILAVCVVGYFGAPFLPAWLAARSARKAK